jgi:pyridoxine 4-dehydrogenase
MSAMTDPTRPVIDAPAAAAGSFTLADGLTVHRMGFGAMRLTGPGIWGPPRDPGACVQLLRRAVDLGVNLIDTADSYGPHVGEDLIARALQPYAEGLVIATKGGFVREGPNRWRADGRPEHLREACEGSLQRLGVKQIDLYQLHIVDRRVPIEDSVGAVADLQAEGKIRLVGVSNVNIDQLARARAVAPIVSVQNRFNLADRGSEAVLAVCEREGLAFLPWAPLERGSLAAAGDSLDRIAQRLGATPGQVALAWLLHHSPVMLPIPGTSSVAHLEENVAAAALSLDRETMTELEG